MAAPNLKTNCLICRSGIENYQNTGLHIPWIEDVTMSLCEALPLDRYLQPILETAVYCDSCLLTMRDMDFTQKNLSALQRRLEDSRARIVNLIENNMKEVGSIGGEKSIIGSFDLNDDYSYEQVLKSVWESVSSDKKPVLVEANGNGNGNGTSHHSAAARPIVSYRHKIILHAPEELSDDEDSSESDYSPEAEEAPVGSSDNGTTSRRGLRKRKKSTVAAPQKSSKKTKTQTQTRTDVKVTPKKSKSTKKCNSENSQPRPREDTRGIAQQFQAIAGQQVVTRKTEVDYNASLPLFRCGCGAAFATRNHLKEHRRTSCLITHPDGIKDEPEAVDSDEEFENGDGDEDGEDEDVPKRLKKSNSTNKKKYSNKKKFICTFEGCQFRCDNEGRFQVHNRKHEGDENPYHCDLCKEARFPLQRLLYDHRRRNCPVTRNTRRNTIRKSSRTGEYKRYRQESETEEDSGDETVAAADSPEFKCSYESCDFTTLSESRYQSHIRIHEGDPLPYWCKLCDKKFPKAKHLNLHKHMNCGDVVTCPMPNCESVFSNKFAIKAHLNTFHYKDGKLECKFCSKIFDQSKADTEFNNHVQIHQAREAENRKFSCVLGDCVANFTNSIDLKTHVLDIHESTTTKCDICEAILANPISLKRHMVEMHAPRRNDLQCNHCSYIGSSRSGLAIHMYRHAETKQFSCTVEGCGSTFRWPSGLRTHMMVHSGVRKYECTFENCKKSFVSRTKLRDHEETHNDRRSYFCDRCAKTFKAKKNLEQHFRYMHRGVKVIQKPRPKKSTENKPTRRPRRQRVDQEKDKIVNPMPPPPPGNEDEEYSRISLESNEIDVPMGSGTWTLTHPQYVGILNPLIYPDGTGSTTIFFH